MNAVSQVYDLPVTPAMECTVRGRIALPGVVMELHHYRFRGQQGGIFSSPRSFLDLALSPRPGRPCGGYGGIGEGRASALGDVLFVPARSELHTEWGEGEQTSICCGFDGMGFDHDEPDLSNDALQASLDVRSPAVREALRRIAGEIAQPGFCSEMLTQAIWLQAAIELQRYLRVSGGDTEIRGSGMSRAQLQRIGDRIEQPGKPPSVAELAAECGLSTRHFFRQFKAATGQTLTRYVADRKIDRAKQLLRQAGPAIKVIAWDCGFDSAAAFSAAFRKATGLTPRQFREGMMH
ncbi:helix-turn-helix transcriptional regulator (plasmid) [Sphingobium sp. SJ10-10]|uniref:helix-turn-helix domain-containing protein n=1 Tax=unclassified Sphingobium TaxID=2611147 RepID=UPI000C9F27DC|nr:MULTISPECIES: helix-turn-helix domain-containing protein [unclassified Sphingobium]MCB4858890.1 helix-turn-helix transcriptional regulator [Sphingobium sp. PNB]MEC6700741.1 helix-turn-helix transcriptional regulator [Sphingobium sp. SJ10-10]PNQ04531.1 AraC family transcriptional regulator [Sphingobium sp. SA916]